MTHQCANIPVYLLQNYNYIECYTVYTGLKFYTYINLILLSNCAKGERERSDSLEEILKTSQVCCKPGESTITTTELEILLTQLNLFLEQKQFLTNMIS